MDFEVKGLDSVEDQQKKRVSRFLLASDEIMELANQLDHDLNFFGDYIGSEKLFEAKKHAVAIYHLVRKVKEEKQQ